MTYIRQTAGVIGVLNFLFDCKSLVGNGFYVLVRKFVQASGRLAVGPFYRQYHILCDLLGILYLGIVKIRPIHFFGFFMMKSR